MSLSIGALIVVWLYMWWVVESLFLATCGIFEILFSLPVAMSIWVVICQQKISSLQPLVVYMILGIGADDVFLVYDSWHQKICLCFIRQVIYIYVYIIYKLFKFIYIHIYTCLFINLFICIHVFIHFSTHSLELYKIDHIFIYVYDIIY